MNYILKIDKDEVVVTRGEYDQIKAGIRNKSNLIFLREGTLVINPIMIKLIQETYKLTTEQERRSEKQLRLPSTDEPLRESRVASGGFQKFDVSEKDGFKECPSCNEVHFLGDKKTCFVCACKAKSNVLGEVF